MKSLRANILLSLALTFALLLQSVLPASLSIAAKAGYDVSAFLCSPSGGAPSQAAQDHMRSLLALVDKKASDTPDTPSTEHCAACVMIMSPTLAVVQFTSLPITYAETAKPFEYENHLSSVSARGPPLGGRAPPLFL